jgi:hypothetical protein
VNGGVIFWSSWMWGMVFCLVFECRAVSTKRHLNDGLSGLKFPNAITNNLLGD